MALFDPAALLPAAAAAPLAEAAFASSVPGPASGAPPAKADVSAAGEEGFVARTPLAAEEAPEGGEDAPTPAHLQLKARLELGGDGNEEQCGACGMGGTLMCCENCPVVFHAECHGYKNLDEAPDDWECFACAGKLVMPAKLKPLKLKAGDEVRVAYSAESFYYYKARVDEVRGPKERGGMPRLLIHYPAWGHTHDEELDANDIRIWRGSIDKKVWAQRRNSGAGCCTPLACTHSIDPVALKALNIKLRHPQKLRPHEPAPKTPLKPAVPPAAKTATARATPPERAAPAKRSGAAAGDGGARRSPSKKPRAKKIIIDGVTILAYSAPPI